MAKEMLEQKEGEDVNIFKIVDNGNPGDILQQQANGDKTFVDPLTVDVLPQDGNPGDILQLDIAGDDQWVDPLTIDTLPDGEKNDVLTIDETDAKVFEPIPVRHFQPIWEQAEYEKGTLTVDDGWTMLSNKLTVERPSPVAIGEPQLGYTGNELYEEGNNISSIASGHIYTFTKDGWIQRLRVRVPLIDPDITYRFIIVNDTTGSVSVIEQTDQIIANEWIDIAIGSQIVVSGTTFRIWVDALNSSSSTTVLGPWIKVTDEVVPGDAPPAPQQWNETPTPHTLNISKQDSASVDRTADLQTLTADTDVEFTDQVPGDTTATYTLTGPGVDEGSFFSFPVTLKVGTAPEDDENCDMVATIPIPSTTAFVFVEDHWTANPDYAVITGFLDFNGIPQGGVFNNGFGIDIQFQEAFVSQDWDYIAGGGVIVNPVLVVSSDATLTGLGIDTDQLSVAQPFTDDDRIKLDGIAEDAIATVATDDSISGIGIVGFELALSIQSDGSLTGSGSVADPVELAVQSDTTLTGDGSLASPLAVDPEFTTVTTDATLTGAGSLASPLSVVEQAQYAEIFQTIIGAQAIANPGATLIFDTDGLSSGAIPDETLNHIEIAVDGTYDIFIQGSVDPADDIEWEIWVYVNALPIRQLGKVEVQAENFTLGAFGFGATLALLDGDLVTIFVVHPLTGPDNFFILPGSRFHLIRLGA